MQSANGRSYIRRTVPMVATVAAMPLAMAAVAIAAQPDSIANQPVVITDGSVTIDAQPGSTLEVAGTVPPPSFNDSATMTVGGNTFICPNSGFPASYRGYATTGYSPPPGRPFGSYAPTVLTGGKSVVGAFEIFNGGTCLTAGANLDVSGFSANPGSTWLVSITCNGTSKSGSGLTPIYSGGTASWHWATLFNLPNPPTKTTCSIVHN